MGKGNRPMVLSEYVFPETPALIQSFDQAAVGILSA
jgi:hypothetical protein